MLATLLAPSFVSAQVRPSPGIGDAHDQSVDFQADQVVRIESAPGYQVMIELAPDERVQSTALGDAGAWQVTSDKAGNHLFAKPLEPEQATNMTVITNVRRYSFVLEALRAPSTTMPYTVRFRYPPVGSLGDLLAGPSALPTTWYRVSGYRALRPRSVRDDGVHTYIDWAPETDLPAVYRRNQMGQETLANGFMRGGVYVLDDVADHLLFRVDDHVAHADRMAPRGKRR